MLVKLDLYRIFITVAKYKSFSKASNELYMTQPAVSQAIMQLERELETRLFTRSYKGVNLSNEGMILYEYINSAMYLINIGEQKILETKNLMIGELKIGVGDTISRYFLLKYLEKFHSKYPNIKLKITNSTTLELCEILKSGDIDIAVCNFPIDAQGFELKKCLEIEDIFVCGEKYKYLLERKVSFEEIANLSLIFLESNSNSRRYVEKFMKSKGVKIVPEIELGSHELLLEFAKINLGVACVVKEFSKEYLERGDLFQIKTEENIPKRSIGLCFLKSTPLSPAAMKFLEILEMNE